MLYFLKTEHYYKIGFAKDSALKERLKQYSTHNPLVELIGIKEGTREDEKRYHFSFSKYEGTGEWFILPKNLVDKIKLDFIPSDLLKRPKKRVDCKNKSYYVKRRGNILQYSLNGELLNTFPTIQDASEKTGVSYWRICNYIKGKTQRGEDFVWKIEKL